MMEQGQEWKLTFKLETGSLEDRFALPLPTCAREHAFECNPQP